MRTRCPNPKCQHEFDVPDERAGKNGPCPACGQVITFRSLEILHKLDRQRARLPAQVPLDSGAVAFSGLLEDVRSLWNVGSMFRTADGAGFTRLHLCGITAYPPRKELSKTSLGAEDHVAWSYHTGALEILPALKSAGVQIVGLERNAASLDLPTALAEGKLRTPLCLLVGNEVAGLSAESLALCDVVCHLSMRGVKESLNVAVAFGIAAYRIAEVLAPKT